MKKGLILLILTACVQLGSAQNYMGNKEDIDDILECAENFSEYVMASDYEKIVQAYTVDAKIFPNNLDIIEGHEGIRAYWQLPEGVKTSHHKLTPLEIKIYGSEAYDYGYYEGRTRKANGEEVSWKGKYVVIWKKVDGAWKMYLDIWNRVKS